MLALRANLRKWLREKECASREAVELRSHPTGDEVIRYADLAEGVGFEPTGPCGPAVFKTAAIDHSATPPQEPRTLLAFRDAVTGNCRGSRKSKKGIPRDAECPFKESKCSGYWFEGFTFGAEAFSLAMMSLLKSMSSRE